VVISLSFESGAVIGESVCALLSDTKEDAAQGRRLLRFTVTHRSKPRRGACGSIPRNQEIAQLDLQHRGGPRCKEEHVKSMLALAVVALAITAGPGCGGSTSDEDDTPTADAVETSASEVTPEVDETAAANETPSDAEELTYAELIDLTIADLDEFWTTTLPEIGGISYETLAAIGPYFPSQGDIPECGGPIGDSSALIGNAFYCSIGDFIAWDEENLFPQLYSDYGDFAVSLVLAHEWGHAIQARGLVEGPTILTELQADCFAGSWTAYVDAGTSNYLILTAGDLDEAIAGYLQFRDAPGTSIDDPGAHGSGFDRVGAFKEGYDAGAGRCADYVNEPPVVVPLEFTSQEDFERRGDLPYDEIAPLMTADIEDYWAAVYPSLFGDEWEPLAAFGPFYVSEPDSLPDCGPSQADAEDYAGTAFYCAADDYVAWDDEGLMPQLYDNFGDFAVAIAIAQEWGHAVQARAGIEGSSTFDLEQQADCFAGSWVASIILGEASITLSPGDLDEAISAFVVFRDAPGTAADDPEAQGTGFQRVAAFQDGVINGAEACLVYAE
jgi:predicted metalloprotease